MNAALPKSQSIRGLNSILDALLIKGKITQDDYNLIKLESVNKSVNADQIVKEKGIVDSDEIAKLYSEMKGIGFIDLSSVGINIEVLHKLEKQAAQTSMAIVFEELPSRFKVAMRDPLDLQRIKYLEAILGKKIEVYYASEDDINNVLESKYGAQITKDVDEALEQVGGDNLLDINSMQENEITKDPQNAPIIRIVNMILDYGIKNKASDVHIESREKKVIVRFRVRGILSEKLTIPKKLLPAVVSRIKILSNLKIDEHRVPQDGRFQVKLGDLIVDIRVSIMPNIYGEKIVMRLLSKTESVLKLEELGMRGINYSRMRDALKKTQGIVIVSGPTGSGKTQTLASSLKILNTPEVNIMTLEDPVEIRVDGVTQVQINPEVGLTFASGLRSFLRQDPDIIMVGEIRDSETASLAVQSALVGRLVLSTLHTNSSAGSFVRLLDMGVEPFLLSSTVNVIIAQRLVRVLCECKQPKEATEEQMRELHKELDVLNSFDVFNSDHTVKAHFDKGITKATLYQPKGCPKCNDSGFISRTGIFEALKMSDTIARAVIQKKTIQEIQDLAISEGMITMVQDGYIKALEGITTLEEVMRVKNE
jgi:type IV pilus assembly protein PilB